MRVRQVWLWVLGSSPRMTTEGMGPGMTTEGIRPGLARRGHPSLLSYDSSRSAAGFVAGGGGEEVPHVSTGLERGSLGL